MTGQVHGDLALTVAVEAGLRGIGLAGLPAGVQRLMDAYRSGEVPAAPVLASGRDAAAYAAYRMPATVAATAAAFAQMRRALPGWLPASALDFGAGTGGASWAVASGASGGGPALTLLEQSAEAIRLGKAILAASQSPALHAASWRSWRLDAGPVPDGADLAVAAYVLGELTEQQQDRLTGLAMRSAPAVLLVEPGTPAGHRRILAARARLLAAGYEIAAPCPHELDCPLAASGDWCHFAARVHRSGLHRRAKSAELSYEDEKFSYVAARRPAAGPADLPGGRVVRRPQQRKNLVLLDLCTAQGRSVQLAVGKSKGEQYRRARKTDWGDRWE